MPLYNFIATLVYPGRNQAGKAARGAAQVGFSKRVWVMVQFAGIASMALALFVFTRQHDMLINIASLWNNLFWFGVFNLVLVVLNNVTMAIAIRFWQQLRIRLFNFFNHRADAVIGITGETTARTRLYQMGINKYLNEISFSYLVQRVEKGSWEEFRYGKNYEQFVLTKKL